MEDMNNVDVDYRVDLGSTVIEVCLEAVRFFESFSIGCQGLTPNSTQAELECYLRT